MPLPKESGFESENSVMAWCCSSPLIVPILAISTVTASTCLGLSLASSLAASSSGRLINSTAALRRSPVAIGVGFAPPKLLLVRRSRRLRCGGRGVIQASQPMGQHPWLPADDVVRPVYIEPSAALTCRRGAGRSRRRCSLASIGRRIRGAAITHGPSCPYRHGCVQELASATR